MNYLVAKSILLAFVFLCFSPVIAANPQLGIPSIRVQAQAHILIDAKTGKVLSVKNENEQLPPASLTKIMLLYIVAAELEKGNLTLDEKVTVSTKAWKTGGSRMFIEAGKKVSVNELIEGIATVSGNDASIALAEYIAGSEERFTQMMNDVVQAAGMTNTNFTNVTGLPEKNLYSSAADMAVISQMLITQFPQFYEMYFSQRTFSYNNIDQINRNKLLWRPNLGVDGIKTGRTDEAGYNLAVSAKNDNMRLIAVLLGASSEKVRLQEGEKILRWGFRYFRTYKIYEPFEPLTTHPVWLGEEDTVNLGVAQPVEIIISKADNHKVNIRVHMQEYLTAPLAGGQNVGDLVVYIGEEEYSRYPLVSLDTVEESNIVFRFFSWIGLYLHQFFW